MRSREAASLTAISAILKLTPSKSLIGRPNCSLVDEYLTASSNAERAIPIIPAATAGRSLSSSSRIIENPQLRRPTRFSLGTRTLRSRRWATLAPLMPRRPYALTTSKPFEFLGITNALSRDRAGLLGDEFIGKGLPRLNRLLGDVGRAIHRIRHRHTVPVNRRFFRQFIAQNDVEPVALIDANLGARELSV